MPALHSYALTSLADLKLFLDITTSAKDDLLRLLINCTTDFIEKYCGRRFKSTVYTNEEYDGTGTPDLPLNQYPIITFTTLSVNNYVDNQDDWETVASTDYFVYTNEGMLKLISNTLQTPQRYRATYTAGYATIPSDLEWACLKICAKTYLRRLGEGVESERLGDHAIVWITDVLQMDKELKAILDLYKRHYIG